MSHTVAVSDCILARNFDWYLLLILTLLSLKENITHLFSRVICDASLNYTVVVNKN